MKKVEGQMEQFVELTVVSNQLEAEKVRLLLLEEGIEAFVQHEKSDQFIQVITGAIDRDLALYVKASALEKAQRLLEEAPELTLEEEESVPEDYEKRASRNRRLLLWIVLGLLILIPVLSMIISGAINSIV